MKKETAITRKRKKKVRARASLQQQHQGRRRNEEIINKQLFFFFGISQGPRNIVKRGEGKKHGSSGKGKCRRRGEEEEIKKLEAKRDETLPLANALHVAHSPGLLAELFLVTTTKKTVFGHFPLKSEIPFLHPPVGLLWSFDDNLGEG